MEGMAETELASLAASGTSAKSPDGRAVEDVPLKDGALTDKNQASCMKNGGQPSSSDVVPVKVEQPSCSEDVPEKVKWVLESCGRNSWKAFVGDQPVPASVQCEWSEKFHQAMHKDTR